MYRKRKYTKHTFKYIIYYFYFCYGIMGLILFSFSKFFTLLFLSMKEKKKEILRTVAISQPYWRMVFLLPYTLHIEQTLTGTQMFHLFCTVLSPPQHDNQSAISGGWRELQLLEKTSLLSHQCLKIKFWIFPLFSIP